MLNNKFWEGKRILVTGHTGFKGSWLTIILLNLGAKVYGYSLEPTGDLNLFKSINKEIKNKINHFIGDIQNLNEFRNYVEEVKPDIVFHLAAQPLVLDSYLNPLKTWSTNLIGTLNLLESLKSSESKCSVVLVTTDKVYKNNEWIYGYRENDILGGHDPYSASKAACEIAISSWRSSFCGKRENKISNLFIGTARAGNVIGGGDFALNRLIPDCMISLNKKQPINIRHPKSTRPWQHVLEPLFGYLLLAEKLYSEEEQFQDSFNFGPSLESNKSVKETVENIIKNWPGKFFTKNVDDNPHEAKLLFLNTDKSKNLLDWNPKWGFEYTLKITVDWYKKFFKNQNMAYKYCLEDLKEYIQTKN